MAETVIRIVIPSSLTHDDPDVVQAVVEAMDRSCESAGKVRLEEPRFLGETASVQTEDDRTVDGPFYVYEADTR